MQNLLTANCSHALGAYRSTDTKFRGWDIACSIYSCEHVYHLPNLNRKYSWESNLYEFWSLCIECYNLHLTKSSKVFWRLPTTTVTVTTAGAAGSNGDAIVAISLLLCLCQQTAIRWLNNLWKVWTPQESHDHDNDCNVIIIIIVIIMAVHAAGERTQPDDACSKEVYYSSVCSHGWLFTTLHT